MDNLLGTKPRQTGFTLLEIMTVTIVSSILFVGVMGATRGISDSYRETQSMSHLLMRAQHAMDRITSMASRAVTADTEFTTFKDTENGAHCLQFRLIDSLAGGVVSYDDELLVFIYGPDAGASPNDGIIIGRGPNLGTVSSLGSGADGTLGTLDDDIRASHADSVAAVELLVPVTFAPSEGEMFNVEMSESGRLLTFTLRMNVKRSETEYAFPDDLVLTQKVALRQ